MKVYAITIVTHMANTDAYMPSQTTTRTDSGSKEWPRLKLWATTWKPVSVR